MPLSFNFLWCLTVYFFIKAVLEQEGLELLFLQLLCPGRCSWLCFTHQVWEKERGGLWGHSPSLFILIKMLRVTSVVSRFSEKKEVKKLLQAPLPPGYQI